MRGEKKCICAKKQGLETYELKGWRGGWADWFHLSSVVKDEIKWNLHIDLKVITAACTCLVRHPIS